MGEYNARSSRNTPKVASYSYLFPDFLGISTIMRTTSGQPGPGSISYKDGCTSLRVPRLASKLHAQRVRVWRDNENRSSDNLGSDASRRHASNQEQRRNYRG